MSFEILTPDGDPFEDVAAPAWEAGTTTDLVEAEVWWHRTDATAAPAVDVYLLIEIEDPDDAGSWLSSGLAPLDERWTRVRVVGETTAEHPEMTAQRTDWVPLGGAAALRLDPIFAGCARAIEVRWDVPGHAAPGPYRVRLTPIGASRALALPAGLTDLDRGVLTGVGDLSRAGLVRGCEVTTSVVADDEVAIAAGTWLHAGSLYGLAPTVAAFDDEDGDGDALASGESYVALLSLDASGVVVTRGIKGVAPVRPALPAGQVFLRWVTVRHTGGAPEIAGTDLDGETLYDRHAAVAGPGRLLTVHPGRILAGGTLRTRSASESLSLPAASTRHLWQLSTGAYQLTATDAAPETTAVPLWTVTTGASDVTALVDRRLYAGGAVVLRLAGDAPGSPGFVADQLVGEGRLWIDRVLCRVDTHGAASSGATAFDLLVDGASIFPTSGAVVPSIAWDADPLFDDGAVPELCELRAGQVVSLETTSYPTGDEPTRVEVLLICRRG